MINKKQYTLKDLKTLAKKHGLTLDIGGRFQEHYELLTPDGYHFSEDKTHGRVEPHRNDTRWKKEAINDLVDFIKYYETRKMPMLEKYKHGCECGWDE